jgi:predicted RND superfamily exporter protein
MPIEGAETEDEVLTQTPAPHGAPDSEEELALSSNRLGWLILRWRFWFIFVSVLLTAVSGYGMIYLTFNPDVKAYFSDDNPGRVAQERIERKYSQASNVLVVLTPANGNVFTPRFLKLISDFTKELWRTPYALRVDSLSNFQELTAKGDDLAVSPLVDTKHPITPEIAAGVRNHALGNHDLVGQLVSAKGDVTAINVVVLRPHLAPDEPQKVVDFVRSMARQIQAQEPGVDVRVTGGVVAELAFVEAAQRDTALLVPGMVIIILGTLLIGMRSITVAFVTSTVIGFTVIITMGLYGWSGEILNTVTAAAPPVIMTLFFADCVHFVMAAVQQQTHGRTREQAITETIRLNSIPLAIKSATSIAGFLALNFSDSPPINQLGNVVAVGSFIGAVLTLTLVPTMLSYLPIPAYSEGTRTHAMLAAMGHWIVARNRVFLIGFIIIFPLSLIVIPRMTVDDNFIHYFDSTFQFRRDAEYLEQRLTGLQQMQFSIPSGAADGITDPAYLKTLDAFATWYRQQPHVAHVSTLADVIKRLNKAMNEDNPAFYKIPDSKPLAAQYLMLYELSLPAGQDLSSLVDVGRSESLMQISLAGASSNETLALADAGVAWLKANAPKQLAAPTGIPLMYSHLTAENTQAMFLGTIVEVSLVSLIMAAALRNWRLGWISVIINLTPAALAFGLWAAFGAGVNLAISIVTSITYGIVTDDTVHTMTKYRWARQILKMQPADAARETLTYTGGAVILSTIALAGGFALLGLSNFNITSVMGILSAMIIGIAGLAELVLLPGLLILFDRSKL